MGFVRVSGYSEEDLELASFNSICNCEYYYLSGRPNDSSGGDTLDYIFGKDYAWAIIVAGNLDKENPEKSRWDGNPASVTYNLAYRTAYTSTTEAKPTLSLPYIIVVQNIKKGDLYRANAAMGSTATIAIIACPLNKNEIGTAPDPDCGYFMATQNNPRYHRSATNYPYGTNFTNNINGEYGVHWYYPSSDTTPDVDNIAAMTSAPSSSSGGNSGGSGSSDDNTPEDEQDPINPGDPF